MTPHSSSTILQIRTHVKQTLLVLQSIDRKVLGNVGMHWAKRLLADYIMLPSLINFPKSCSYSKKNILLMN